MSIYFQRKCENNYKFFGNKKQQIQHLYYLLSPKIMCVVFD